MQQNLNFCNIISGKGHIIFIEHLQSAHNIVFRKTVDVLHTHIIVSREKKDPRRGSHSPGVLLCLLTLAVQIKPLANVVVGIINIARKSSQQSQS